MAYSRIRFEIQNSATMTLVHLFAFCYDIYACIYTCTESSGLRSCFCTAHLWESSERNIVTSVLILKAVKEKTLTRIISEVQTRDTANSDGLVFYVFYLCRCEGFRDSRHDGDRELS